MSEFTDRLRMIADDEQLIWSVPRKAVENELIDFRDAGLSMLGFNNGFVVKSRDGEPSSIIRLSTAMGITTALKALADHLEEMETE